MTANEPEITLSRGTVTYDIEIAPNGWVVVVRMPDGTFKEFIRFGDRDDTEALREFDMFSRERITFNGRSFDEPLLRRIFNGGTCEQLWSFAQRLIEGNSYKQPEPGLIDLFWVLGGPRVAKRLKAYQAVMGLERIVEMPFEPGQPWEDIEAVLVYCRHDVDSTWQLYRRMEQDIETRREIGEESLARTDTEIGVAIFNPRIDMNKARHRANLFRRPETVSYAPPPWGEQAAQAHPCSTSDQIAPTHGPNKCNLSATTTKSQCNHNPSDQ